MCIRDRPGADVEVELYNKDKKYEAPNEYMVTQVVKADANGVFTYAVPFAGWWGSVSYTHLSNSATRWRNCSAMRTFWVS